MDLSRSTPFNTQGSQGIVLENSSLGVSAFGAGASKDRIDSWLQTWLNTGNISALVILAGSRTAEIEGISSAGSTAASRRYTAIADAELLLRGPSAKREWPLPSLPAGISPALISHVAASLIGLKPFVLAMGLEQWPNFPHLRVESLDNGPANCLSTGKAMSPERVQRLWSRGFFVGLQLTQPLLMAECVPGGTTTAQAVLTGMGLNVADLISGSSRKPPISLKKRLVAEGLIAANLELNPSSKKLLAAVGDPFQAFAAGLLLGAREAGQSVLLGGGSQMLAVLALALQELKEVSRPEFIQGVAIGTTSWLATEENPKSHGFSSLVRLIDMVGSHFKVDILGMSTLMRFHSSPHKVLRDFELGYVKEGVGAGAFAISAQLCGISINKLVRGCDCAVQDLEPR